MQELEKRKIPITLSGKEFYLRYDLNSMAYLQHYYGNIDELLDKEHEQWNFDDVVHLLRAGLLDFNFDENEVAISKRNWEFVYPSIAGIGRLIDMQGLSDIVLQIVHAMIDAYPDAPIGADTNFQ